MVFSWPVHAVDIFLPSIIMCSMFIHLIQWLPYNSRQAIYIAWRWIMACYFCNWFILSGTKFNNTVNTVSTKLDFMAWVLYLIVSALACTVKFTFHVYPRIRGNDSVNTHAKGAERKDVESGNSAADGNTLDIYAEWRTDSVAWYQKIQWILYSIALPVEIGTLILYGFQLYNPIENSISGFNFNVYRAPALIAVADIWLSGITPNIYHIYMVHLFGVVYNHYCFVGGVDQFGNDYNYSVLYYGWFPFFYVYLISLPRRWLSNKIHQLCYKE